MFQPTRRRKLGDIFDEIVLGKTTLSKEAEAPQSQTPARTESSPSVQRPPVEARKLFADVKDVLARRSYLSETDSATVAYWVISTWFVDVLWINPCLVITGPAHEATNLLHLLDDLCANSGLLAGVQWSDIKYLARGSTLLISKPDLDSRTAVLLGNLTNRRFSFMEGQSWRHCAASVAIYIGENSTVRQIQNSISIDVTASPNAKPRPFARPLDRKADPLVISFGEYSRRNREKVQLMEFAPAGLSLETYAIANALGSCLVDAADLQTQLIALLKPRDQQRLAERSESLEALTVAAALNLCQQGRDELFVKDIAIELNRLLEARGETQRLNPEKVGHGLKRIGLLTRRLSQAGNGLRLDQATRQHLHALAEVYLQEDLNN